MALEAGTRLGPYEILSLLGSGGMGEVYRALDPRLGREVAIKVLPSERMDEERRRRFAQEARAASALNHPNIVTIHEIESADERDFIVMEYVAGKSLDRLISRQGMPLGEVLRIAIPIADALARAHGRGIVHRDVKPSNVVVGSEGAVKLLDFGLAKLVASAAASPEAETETAERRLTRAGAISGTTGYMSPEQASGRDVDARTDIFSFGALLYEMATGQRAFAGDSAAATLAAVMREQPKAPSEVAPDVPRDLERVILRCLRKEADRRYQSMADVRLELEQIKEDSDSQQQAGAAPALRRRRRHLVIAALAAVLLLAAASWLVLRRRAPGLPASTARAAHGAAWLGVVSHLLAGRRASGVQLGRGDPEELRHPREARRFPADPPAHHGPRSRLRPELVPRRPADRLRPRVGGRGGDDPPRLTSRRIGPQVELPLCDPGSPLVVT